MTDKLIGRDAASCDCPPHGVSRRGFLGGAAGLAALGMASGLGPFGNTQLAYADAGYTGDVLVVVSLRGGFDGLSAVVPLNDPNYSTLRPNIGLKTSQLTALDGTFGLHPALSPLLSLWNRNQLALIHATGQPDPTMSHFQDMADMERADPSGKVTTGWIDRLSVALGPASSPFAETSIGPSTAPSSMIGTFPATGMNSIHSFSLSGVNGNLSNAPAWHTALEMLQSGAPPLVKGPALTTLSALDTTESLSSYSAGASYPSDDVGGSLSNVAQLIKAGVGLRVAAVDFNNWDMHVGLGSATNGWMHDNLTNLAQAFTAFATDLSSSSTNVVLVTLSEFGRRAGENDSGGVDHGMGNAMFVMGCGASGGGINGGGTVYGDWKGLANEDLVEGNVKITTDYRNVLAEILSKRCGLSSGEISSVFPGLSLSPLGLAKPA
jgi:uncharacterized protein (DUF1501 family)